MNPDPIPSSFEQIPSLKINDGLEQIAANTELYRFLNQMLALVCETSQAEHGLFYLPDTTTNTLVVEATWGIEGNERLLGIHFGLQEGLAGDVYQSNQLILNQEIDKTIFLKVELNALYRMTLHNVMTVPLSVAGEPVGVIQVYNFAQDKSEELLQICNRLAPHLQKLCLLHASQEQNRKLEGLVGILNSINSTYEQEHILTMIIEGAKQLLNAEASSLFLVEEETGDLVLWISSSQSQEGVTPKNLRVPAGKGIIGYVVATGETVIVADAKRDERHYDQADDMTHFVTRSILAVPLRTQAIKLGSGRGATNERIIGGLEALNKRKGTFNADDSKLLEMFASLTATVLQKANLWKDANELYLDVIRAFSAAIDAKDPYTQGHVERVAKNSVAIGKELGLDAEILHHLHVGAMLHDVGKLHIDDSILKKPGALTDEEYQIMKTHPLKGEEIMRKVNQFKTETHAILEHHEKFDGSGYPRGLKGEEISLVGRIVAVADAFDAITSDRPYRRRLTPEEAFQRLLGESGNSFDEECVHALFRAYKKQTITLQR